MSRTIVVGNIKEELIYCAHFVKMVRPDETTCKFIKQHNV